MFLLTFRKTRKRDKSESSQLQKSAHNLAQITVGEGSAQHRHQAQQEHHQPTDHFNTSNSNKSKSLEGKYSVRKRQEEEEEEEENLRASPHIVQIINNSNKNRSSNSRGTSSSNTSNNSNTITPANSNKLNIFSNYFSELTNRTHSSSTSNTNNIDNSCLPCESKHQAQAANSQMSNNTKLILSSSPSPSLLLTAPTSTTITTSNTIVDQNHNILTNQNNNINKLFKKNSLKSTISANASTTTTALTTTTNQNSTSYLDENNLKLAIVDYNDIVKLVKLQDLIETNEWLAFNTKMYFDQINVVYGAIADHCTLQTCPQMNGGQNNQQFFWLDEKGKKLKYSAPQYIDQCLTYCSKVISDEHSFPTKIGSQFPGTFESLVKKIHKYLYQVLLHMYQNHYKELLHLKLNTYVNSIYFHLLLFHKAFNTLDEKDVDLMDSLNKSLLNKYVDHTTLQQIQNLNSTLPTIHQPAIASSSSSSNATTSSSGGGGFSFFKKKLNFNLMT